jgi:transcription elongation GreA/GreB family factor
VPPAAPRRRDLELPPGVPNYVTASGERALREELAALGPEDKQRLSDLTCHLAQAELVAPTSTEQVTFGAAVTLAGDDERTMTYRIVGVHEADPRAGLISFLSPVARALLGRTVGDLVRLPSGEA